MKAFVFLATIVLFAVAQTCGQETRSPQRTTGAQDGAEILTRGPVHEAFAETITFDPEPGVIAPKAPPEAIDEVPPLERPEGENVTWIAGYWAWDDERKDYLWVSGVWRALPPGRQWVPGYWTTSTDGAQWISGYWADAEATEIEYLPEPPGTMEVGPSIAAPSVDHRWLPGCWLWRENRYAWRPGYWSVGQANWNWIPAHYVWTPRGCVFVDGYYDYGVDRRGIVYAPVYFDPQIYSQRRFSFSPSVAISPAVFISHLFLRPSYGHYYFGDYYASGYATRGFSPGFAFYSNQRGYDPFFAQQSWNHRQNNQWRQNLEANFQNYRENESARPPRTWDDQSARMANPGARDRREVLIAASLAELVKNQNTTMRFQKLDEDERKQIVKHEQAVSQFRKDRQQLEARVFAARPDPSSKQPRDLPGAKVKLPRSPIVAPPLERISKENAPPKREEAPPPDMKVEPKPRASRPPGINPANPKVPRNLNASPGNKAEPKPGKPISDSPKTDPPRTVVPRNASPKQPVPRMEPPKTPAAKAPRLPAPKQPEPKQPTPKQPKPQMPMSKQPAPRAPAQQLPLPKNGPPKTEAPKSDPRGKPTPKPQENPQGDEKKPKE